MTTRRDLSIDLTRVVCVLFVVVIHLLFVGVGRDASGELVISRPVEEQPWFAAVTWAGQTMPLFFVVGGFAGIAAWRSTVRRGGSATDYVAARVLRLARPTLALFVFFVVVVGGATLFSIAPQLVAAVVEGAGSPLWFVAAYGACQALVPVMVRLHERAPRSTAACLMLGVVVVDAMRYGWDVTELGYLNLVFVWVLVQQIGFAYADGWFARRAPWQLAVVAAGCYAALVPLTTLGPYRADMLVNLNPPTLPLVVLGLAQACLLWLFRPALSRLMSTRPARVAVAVAGTRQMTIYLWHLPVIILVAGLGLLVPGGSPEPGTSAWWWSRPIVYALVLGVLLALSIVVARWERPQSRDDTPPLGAAVAATVLVVVPPLLVTVFLLDLLLATVGAACFAVAILLVRPRPERPGRRQLEPEVAAEIAEIASGVRSAAIRPAGIRPAGVASRIRTRPAVPRQERAHERRADDVAGDGAE